MTLAVRKYLFGKHCWIKRLLKIINAILLSRFCCLFSLRQGTILIAIIDLSLTSFCLFLLLLGATHAQDIVTLVASDLQQLEDNNLSERVLEESSTYFVNNEEKMLIGQHQAAIIMFIVWVCLLFTSIHFIACILLLYGVIRSSPKCLLPWTSTALFSLISGCFFLISLAFVPLQECKLGIFAVLITFYAMEIYAWLVVMSYYQALKSLPLHNLNAVLFTNNNNVEMAKALSVAQETGTNNCYV